MSKVFEILKIFKRKVFDEIGKGDVILFGSYAKDEAKNESDIDVIVILEREVDIRVREAIYDIAYEISLQHDVVLDVSVYSRAEWERYRGILPFIINVEKEGIVV